MNKKSQGDLFGLKASQSFLPEFQQKLEKTSGKVHNYEHKWRLKIWPSWRWLLWGG